MVALPAKALPSIKLLQTTPPPWFMPKALFHGTAAFAPSRPRWASMMCPSVFLL